MKESFGRISITSGTRDRKNTTCLYPTPHPFGAEGVEKLKVSFAGPYDFGKDEGATVSVEVTCPTEIDDVSYVVGAKETFRYGKVDFTVRLLIEILAVAMQDRRHQLSKDELSKLLSAMSVATNEPIIRKYGE